MSKVNKLSFYAYKNWWLVTIWFLSVLFIISLWGGAYWFLDKHIDLFNNVDIAVLKYDVILGPLFIGSLTELWYYPILASGIFLVNNLILLLIKRFAFFYKVILVIATMFILALINVVFYVLILINLK